VNKLSQIISTLFYIGYFKWMPGTMGSLLSIAIIILLKHFLNNIFFICIFVFLFFISLKLIEIYSKSINKHDSSEIVIDEFLGIYLIMIFLDYISFSNILIDIILAFIFFRIFDILKPFPINFIDKKFNNSFGVIFDDIIAGIYSLVTLFLINAFI
tara:strand:- start:1071 stop:1538 length:468 start_codon:yes stop_codon:yes gene_type:complete